MFNLQDKKIAIGSGVAALLALVAIYYLKDAPNNDNTLTIEDLPHLRAHFYDATPLEVYGAGPAGSPIAPAEIRSTSLPAYLMLRQQQIADDLKNVSETGVIPEQRKLGIDLSFALFQGVTVSHSNFTAADLSSAQFQEAKITHNIFERAALDFANFSRADLSHSNFNEASLLGADLSHAVIEGIKWNQKTVFYLANIRGVINPPDGFIEYARSHGAVDLDKEEWKAHIQIYLDTVKASN